MLLMAKKKPGRPRDPQSKRSLGVNRYVNPRVVFHLDKALYDELKAYCDSARPRPTMASALEAAVEQFLASVGRWPPVAKDLPN